MYTNQPVNFPSHVLDSKRTNEPVSVKELIIRGVTLKVSRFEDGYVSVKNDAVKSAERASLGGNYGKYRSFLGALHLLLDNEKGDFVIGAHCARGIANLTNIYDRKDRVLHVNWDKLNDGETIAKLSSIGVFNQGEGNHWVIYHAQHNKVYRTYVNEPRTPEEQEKFIADWESAGNASFDYKKSNKQSWDSQMRHDSVDTLLRMLDGRQFVGLAPFEPTQEWDGKRVDTLNTEWNLLWKSAAERKAFRDEQSEVFETQDAVNRSTYVVKNVEDYKPTEFARESKDAGSVIIFKDGNATTVSRSSMVQAKVRFVHKDGTTARGGRPFIKDDFALTAALDIAFKAGALLEIVE